MLKDYNDTTTYEFTDVKTGITAFICSQNMPGQIVFGGMRVDKSVSRDLVEDLQENMFLKLGLHGSPVGAAKAGIQCAPDSADLKEFLVNFAQHHEQLLTNGLILGKDMGAKQWMLDDIYKAVGRTQIDFSSAMGTATKLCEMEGYIQNMTGKGVFWATRELHHNQLEGKRMAVQGVGAVGAGFIRHSSGAGAMIVAVCDKETCLHNVDGLDVEAVLDTIDSTGLMNTSLLSDLGTVSHRDALLSVTADTLVLAGGSETVHRGNVADIAASSIVEAANLAITSEARKYLQKNAIVVVPDICANSSSATLVGMQLKTANKADPAIVWRDIELNIVNAVRYLLATGFDRSAGYDSKVIVAEKILNVESEQLETA